MARERKTPLPWVKLNDDVRFAWDGRQWILSVSTDSDWQGQTHDKHGRKYRHDHHTYYPTLAHVAEAVNEQQVKRSFVINGVSLTDAIKSLMGVYELNRIHLEEIVYNLAKETTDDRTAERMEKEESRRSDAGVRNPFTHPGAPGDAPHPQSQK